MKVISHRISIQSLLFQTCLPTRQNGVDKAYLFPMENYFTAATKRVISSMQSFTKTISGRKGKDSAEIFPSSEY